MKQHTYRVTADEPRVAVPMFVAPADDARVLPYGFTQISNRTLDWYISRLGEADLKAYLYLCRHAKCNDSFKVRAGYSEIAAGVGLSLRAVKYAINRLRGIGLVNRLERGGSDEDRVANLYQLRVPVVRPVTESAPVHQRALKPVHGPCTCTGARHCTLF